LPHRDRSAVIEAVFYAAAIQMSSGSDKRANLDRAEELIRTAVKQGARLVVLPEVFSWRGPRGTEAEFAESIPGPTSERLGAIARELDIHLQPGSIAEAVAGERRCYNTALLFTPSGEIAGLYRKIHLFDVEIPGQVTAKESEARKPGQETVVVPTAIGAIGLSVCYDLRFPELYRRLVRAGAEILCIPSAFTFPTGAAHWEPLVRARAIENQCYVIAPDQYGTSPNGHRDYGGSMIVDPWGAVVARASEGEAIILAEIRLDYLRKVRKELPCLTHVRLGS
jgi:deaminated glutathione amidase